MFALAQIMYISAFGFIPLNIALGTILYAMCSLGNSLIILNDSHYKNSATHVAIEETKYKDVSIMEGKA